MNRRLCTCTRQCCRQCTRNLLSVPHLCRRTVMTMQRRVTLPVSRMVTSPPGSTPQQPSAGLRRTNLGSASGEQQHMHCLDHTAMHAKRSQHMLYSSSCDMPEASMASAMASCMKHPCTSAAGNCSPDRAADFTSIISHVAGVVPGCQQFGKLWLSSANDAAPHVNGRYCC